MGLVHSDVEGSVMGNGFPIELHEDDKKGIQKIYGMREATANEKPTETTTRTIPGSGTNETSSADTAKKP